MPIHLLISIKLIISFGDVLAINAVVFGFLNSFETSMSIFSCRESVISFFKFDLLFSDLFSGIWKL